MNVNSLLYHKTPYAKHPNWKGIEGTFVSVVFNCLKNAGINPNKVFIDKSWSEAKETWVIQYNGRKRTIKRATGLSADGILKVVQKLEGGSK